MQGLSTMGTGGWAQAAQNLYGQAGSSFGAMQQKQSQTTTTKGPGKTIGGGLQSAASMGIAGAMTGAKIGSIGGPMGAGIGAAIGLGAYLFS